MATNGNNGAQFTSTNAPSTVSATSGGAEPSSDSNLGKDEVAWFFVEQYYTTLSKTPEKLHLFYGKRSQFVVGREAEVANVSVGRQSIQERLKQLDLQDCKVRVSNVDSQASYDNIVIQVIGETSNKAGTPKKFVQTFVLAQQPSGYFVLNDLLRYIDDEGDEENTEEETAAAVEAPVEIPAPEAEAEQPTETSASVEEAAAPALDAGVVDKKLEEVSAAPEPANGDAPKTETAAEADAPETSSQPNPEATLQELVAEEIKEPEKPADPSPTPVQSRQPAPPPAAPAPTGPPKPMTWASRAAAAAVPKPVTPLPKTATPPTQARPAAASATQAASAAPSSTTAAAAPVAAPAATASEDAGPAKESSEWQTAGSDSKRQGKPQATTGAQTEKEGTMGYVKYVTDKVKHDELKQALAQHGEVVYFDINRQKNCAFVEFATIAGYQAAVAANPHVINGESIQVEPRRPKAGAYGGSNYASGRGGGAPSRGGRGGFEGGRSGSSGGRGSFGGPRGGRGGAGAGTGAPRGGAGGAWSTA